MKNKAKVSRNVSAKYILDKKQRKIFLLILTRELIRNSGEDLFKLKKATEKDKNNHLQEVKHPQKKTIKDIVRERLSEEKSHESENLNEIFEKRKVLGSVSVPQRSLIPRFKIPVLRIPESRLPPQFHYLRPTITSKEIDLGELNQYINDSQVMSIEIQGPNQNVYVQGAMGRKRTDLILDKNQINEVINRFSRESRIPVIEGLFKVVVGKLILSAVISEEIGSSFIIRKIPQMRSVRRF